MSGWFWLILAIVYMVLPMWFGYWVCPKDAGADAAITAVILYLFFFSAGAAIRYWHG
ncbi:MAG: hypothetical protein LBE24_10595 [Methylobacillus sp.]|jgi:hypothetical protein|nr:hypothetical protein [Methylobacillus sp.]